MNTHIISQDVFDKIRSRFSNLEMGDPQGEVTSNPKEAHFFDFDFVVEDKNLGRVSISINEIGCLKVFYSQNILEDSDDFTKDIWYDFLREMRMFAKRRLLRFDTRDITKKNLDKDDFQHLASSSIGNMDMNESIKFEGTKKTSRRVLEKTTLIVRHRNSIETEQSGARSRKNNIKALFIENSEGERFKYPFVHIAGAKAMQRHVANGGRPYDDHGNAIIRMSEQISQLTEFKRKVSHDNLNQSVNEITNRANTKLESLRRQVEGLCGQGYYDKWKENFVPNAGSDLVMDQATLEDYKHKFTISSFKEELAQYFPLIHSIMQEANTVDLEDIVSEGEKEEHCDVCDRTETKCVCDDVKEHTSFRDFVEWANRVEEGKLGMDQLGDLHALLEKGLSLGVDGVSAIEALEDIGVHDEELFAKLEAMADPEQGGNPETDAKDEILSWLSTTDPEAAQEFGYEPTDESDTETKEVASPRSVAELVYSMYNKNHKEENVGPFPKGKYGVLTAVKKQYGDEGMKMAEVLVNYLDPHENEGMAGSALGGVAGAMATKTPAGAMAGADIGSTIQDKLRESAEDRTSYQVAKFLFDKGLRYNPQNEKQIINKMDDAMIAMNMSAKTIQYLLRHDEDFISDTLSELQHMESAIDELAMAPTEGAAVDAYARGDSAALANHAAQMDARNGSNVASEGIKDIAKKVGGAVKAGAKAVGKAITGPDDDELLSRLEKETGGKRPNAYNKPKNEGTDDKKFDPLKHVKNPTQGEKDAAKDVKRGSYADRSAMLKSAEADGRLKNEDINVILKLAGLAK